MALFQKKPSDSNSIPLYRLDTDSSYLILGLGNPGKDYLMSRHNAGFMVLDKFAELNSFPVWQSQKKHMAKVTMARLGSKLVILAKPQTFMNASGQSTGALQKFYRIANQQTLVVYDEMALPIGQLRARAGGSDAGHNGIKSLIDTIGQDFGRLRLGIAPERSIQDTSRFVLAKFNRAEQAKLPDIILEACAMISEFIYSGELPHDTRTLF